MVLNKMSENQQKTGLRKLVDAVTFGPENRDRTENRAIENPQLTDFLKVWDFDVLNGRLDMTKGLVADNVISSQAVLKPCIIFDNIGDSAVTFQRTSIATAPMSFATDGTITVGGVTASSAAFTYGVGVAAGVLGILVQIRANDTQSGQVSATITHGTSGLVFSYALRNVNEAGYAFIWSHAASNKAVSSQSLAGGGGAVTNTVGLTSTAITDEFVVRVAGQDLTIAGVNAIISIYPIYITDAVAESLLQFIGADQLETWPASVIADFAGRGTNSDN